MKVRADRPRKVEQRPCPTCGAVVNLYRDEDGGLLFAAPEIEEVRQVARAQMGEAQQAVRDAVERGAEIGWRAGYEHARKQFSLGGRLIGLVLWVTNPKYRAMRRRSVAQRGDLGA